METLISFLNGSSTSESRLDAMFIPGLSDGNVGAGNGAGTAIFNPGNEPSFGTPFLYHYFGRRQWKSVLRSREIVDQYYTDGRDGVPGNSDAGALESWMVWNLLGKSIGPGMEIFINCELITRTLSSRDSASIPASITTIQGFVDQRGRKQDPASNCNWY